MSDLRRLINNMGHGKTHKIGKGTFSTVLTAATRYGAPPLRSGHPWHSQCAHLGIDFRALFGTNRVQDWKMHAIRRIAAYVI